MELLGHNRLYAMEKREIDRIKESKVRSDTSRFVYKISCVK
jgi:hypothetical protein